MGSGAGGGGGPQADAGLIGAAPQEIVFTSGATESDNLAIKGVAEAYAGKGDHIVTSAIEHKAVLDACRSLEQRGCRVTCLPVGRDGLVDPGAVRAAIGERTVLVSIMYANNEMGTIQPVAEIGGICRERGVLFHSDAAQAVGKSAGGCGGGPHRPALDFGAQDVRSQGRGRAVRAAAESARAIDGADGWRRSRARHAVGHAERAWHRGLGRGVRHLRGGKWARRAGALRRLRDRLRASWKRSWMTWR